MINTLLQIKSEQVETQQQQVAIAKEIDASYEAIVKRDMGILLNNESESATTVLKALRRTRKIFFDICKNMKIATADINEHEENYERIAGKIETRFRVNFEEECIALSNELAVLSRIHPQVAALAASIAKKIRDIPFDTTNAGQSMVNLPEIEDEEDDTVELEVFPEVDNPTENAVVEPVKPKSDDDSSDTAANSALKAKLNRTVNTAAEKKRIEANQESGANAKPSQPEFSLLKLSTWRWPFRKKKK